MNILLIAPRFSERDLMMHFHAGLGVGHMFSQRGAPAPPVVADATRPANDGGPERSGIQEQSDVEMLSTEESSSSPPVPLVSPNTTVHVGAERPAAFQVNPGTEVLPTSELLPAPPVPSVTSDATSHTDSGGSTVTAIQDSPEVETLSGSNAESLKRSGEDSDECDSDCDDASSAGSIDIEGGYTGESENDYMQVDEEPESDEEHGGM